MSELKGSLCWRWRIGIASFFIPKGVLIAKSKGDQLPCNTVMSTIDETQFMSIIANVYKHHSRKQEESRKKQKIIVDGINEQA